jgi:hypothetical protein
MNAAAILREHNAWRRGAETPQPSPEQIGIAIDLVLAVVDAAAPAAREPDDHKAGPYSEQAAANARERLRAALAEMESA